MKKKIFFILILVLYFLFFSFFIYYRLFLEKVSRDSLIFLFILLLFLFLPKVFKIGLRIFFLIYKKIRKPTEEKNQKIVNFAKNKIESLDFLMKEFKEKFLFKSMFFRFFSLFWLKFYQKNQKNQKIYLIFLILPWIALLTVFFSEILFFQNFYFFLYILPLTFILKKFGELILWCASLESKKALNLIFEKNFPNFYYFEKENLKDFFLVNKLIKCHFFFHVPKFKTKKHLIFFWNLFNEITYYNLRYRSLVDFFKPYYRNLTELFFEINSILYFCSFVILLRDSFFWWNYFLSTDFVSILIIFFCVFLIFLCFLKFLNKDFDLDRNTQYKNYFQQFSNLEEFYQDQLSAIKKELLETYCFLEIKDFQQFSKTSSIFFLHKNRNFYDIPMTVEEFNFFFLEQRKILSWFKKEDSLGRINMEIFEHEKPNI